MNAPPNEIVIRTMTEADIPRVSEILRAAFRWLAEQEGFDATQLAFLLDRASEQTVREESKTRPHIVACIGAVVVGMAVVNGNVIARMYVDPAWHRKGVGRTLHEAVIEMIRAEGYGEATVAALVASSQTFYEAMGMRVYGRQVYEPSIFPDRKITLLRLPL
jgi:predicted N-acetyltransferase YhbS